jgi:hypothetical protein
MLSLAACAALPPRRLAATQMRNAGIQRIALHPKAIKRNVFRIAWRALKQQNPNGRQEKGSTHIDATELFTAPHWRVRKLQYLF